MLDNRTSSKFIYLTMSRNRLRGTSNHITIDVMPASGASKDAAFFSDDAQKINALHAYSITPI